MTENELQQIQKIGASYCTTLGGLVDGMANAEAQAHFLRMTLDAILRQYIQRRGLTETSAFLHHVADNLSIEARKLMQ